jgi:hypothetical protein
MMKLMRSMAAASIGALVACAVASFALATGHAAEGPSGHAPYRTGGDATAPPSAVPIAVGDYKDYALGPDAPPSQGGIRVVRQGDGWTEVAAASAQTRLRMPAGWCISDDLG